jgi:uncharacterized membrane protein YhaH (DUF805 family)
MNHYLNVWKNFANFKGRATRSEYWLFVLFNAIIFIILSQISLLIDFPYLSIIYYLAILIPTLAVGVRRMHDVGKSGWFLLVPIYNLILSVTDSQRGENQYGQDLNQQ